MALLHPHVTATRQQQHPRIIHDNLDVDDEDDDNDLQFAPTRALGVSEFEDDLELYELNRNSRRRYHQNNNNSSIYDGGGGNGGVGEELGDLVTGVSPGARLMVTPKVASSGQPPPVMPRKCSTNANSIAHNNYEFNNVKQSTAVDI